MLDQATWDDWLQHPATKALREHFRRRQEMLKDRWASGEFTDVSQYGAAILNAKAIGQCEAIQDLIDLDFELINVEQHYD